MNSLFQRMSQGILAVLGEPCVFGTSNTITKINIQYGIQLQGMDGQNDYGGEHDVATVDGALNPQLRDSFRLLDASGNTLATYRLEKRLRNNGANQQFVVLKVS